MQDSKNFSMLLGEFVWTYRYTIIAVLAAVLLLRKIITGKRRPDLPTINEFSGDWTLEKARNEYLMHAEELLEKGAKQYPNQPFRVITTLGERIMLPQSYFSWIKSTPTLDHQAAVAEEFFGRYPGFEAIGAFNAANHYIIDLVKQKMSAPSSPMLQTFAKEARRILNSVLGEATEYHTIEWGTVARDLIYELSSSTFVGRRIANTKEWKELTQSHTTSIFLACRALRSWRPELRPFVHWFIPECQKCRAQLRQAQKLLKRFGPAEAGEENTALAWIDSRKGDPAALQLALAAGAMHTTAQLLQQSLLDLALASTEQPDVLKRVRSEIDDILGLTSGEFVPSTLPKLSLLDACVKETQRFKPGVLSNLDRIALQDVTLPNGMVLPKGSYVALSSISQWDTTIHGPDAMAWRPRRYFTEKPDGTLASKTLVSTNEGHFAFGTGKFICPGRFFAAAEIKVALALILKDWDVRLEKESLERVKRTGKAYVPPNLIGFEMLADEEVKVQVRRRREPC